MAAQTALLGSNATWAAERESTCEHNKKPHLSTRGGWGAHTKHQWTTFPAKVFVTSASGRSPGSRCEPPTPSQPNQASGLIVDDLMERTPSTGYSGGTAADLHCLPYYSVAEYLRAEPEPFYLSRRTAPIKTNVLVIRAFVKCPYLPTPEMPCSAKILRALVASGLSGAVSTIYSYKRWARSVCPCSEYSFANA
jgi:hypothetical protein